MQQLSWWRQLAPESSSEQKIQTETKASFKNCKMGLIQVKPALLQLARLNEDVLLLSKAAIPVPIDIGEGLRPGALIVVPVDSSMFK